MNKEQLNLQIQYQQYIYVLYLYWYLYKLLGNQSIREKLLQQTTRTALIIKSVTDSVGRKLIYNYTTKTFTNRTGKILTWSLSENRNRSEGKLGLGVFFSVLRRIAPLFEEKQREIAQIQLFCSRFSVLGQTPNIEGPGNLTVQFKYFNDGNLQQVRSNCSGNDALNCKSVESYAYSSDLTTTYLDYKSNLLEQITDNQTGASREYVYEDVIINYVIDGFPAGSVVDKRIINSMVETDGGITDFEYSNTTGLNDSATVSHNGVVSAYTLNNYGAASNVSTLNGGKVMVWDIDDEIQLQSETDENGRNKSFTYDDNGNITQQSIGNISKNYTYKPATNAPPYINDRIETYSNWRGKVTTYTYDEQGNKTSETLAGDTISYQYNTQGLVSNITDANNNIQLFEYDIYGQLTKQTDGAGNAVNTTWDIRGRKLSQTDANAHITTFEYDSSDRIISKTLDDRQWSYDYSANNLIKTETDPNENTTTYSYDRMGRLLNILNAATNNFTYSYDDNGNKLSENDFKGNLTTFIYDDTDRLITKTQPEGKVTVYTYDNVGNVLSETTADRKAIYSYDLNRYFLTSFTGDESAQGGGNPFTAATTARTVDGEGNILTETDPNGNLTTFTYDDFNRLLTEDGELGSGRIIVYDGNGNILSETSKNSTGNQTRTFSYDVSVNQTTLYNSV